MARDVRGVRGALRGWPLRPGGDVFVWNEGPITVYNLGTQVHWRKKAQPPALAKALRKMVEAGRPRRDRARGIAEDFDAGLGGLDWMRVKRVLTEVGSETTVTLTVFEQFVRWPRPRRRSDAATWKIATAFFVCYPPA